MDVLRGKRRLRLKRPPPSAKRRCPPLKSSTPRVSCPPRAAIRTGFKNVAVDLQRFCWLVENGFETSLKQWSDSTVFSIEPHAVADIKPMERFAKVGLSALQLEMVVVTHWRNRA